MKLARRTLIKAGLVASGGLGMGPIARALPGADFVIHDSRFTVAAPDANRTIDLVYERRSGWSTIRGGLGQARRIDGITAWSDYVMIAHELERRGFCRAAEIQVGRLWQFTLLRKR